MPDPNIGRKIANRYELIESVGRGSMGKVYLAGDSLLGGVPVAVKFLSQTLLNEDMRSRFFREAMTCAQLGQKSMHVVRVTDYGVEEDVPFYVMEYLKGENIGHLVQKQPLPVPRFLGLVRQILLGLRTAHYGILLEGERVPIIHRDIKPSNILVISDPLMGELVKILDFGIAKLMQAGSEQTATFMGTLAYASPEQMEGRDLDSRSDIYSLGVMMYQMLSGKLPVKPANNTFGSWYKVHRLAEPKAFTEFGPTVTVPKALEDIVMACLAKQREHRPSTIEQIIEAISPLEDRFGSSFEISQRINSTLSKQPTPNPKNSAQVASSDDSHDVSKQATSKKGLNAEIEPLIAPLEPLLELPCEQEVVDRVPLRPLSEMPPLEPPLEPLCEKPALESSPDIAAASAEDNFYLQQQWPSAMPIAQIVFPRLLQPADQQQPTLWAMLPIDEIRKRMDSTRYNNFMCTMAPHPMVLWLTAFYHKLEGPRWLPCYLDLKEAGSQQILWTLAEAQQYRILFFAEESPHDCRYVRSMNVAASQRKLFQEWVTMARNFPSIGSAQESKALLKQELENQLKPRILMNFKAIHIDSTSGIEASVGF